MGLKTQNFYANSSKSAIFLAYKWEKGNFTVCVMYPRLQDPYRLSPWEYPPLSTGTQANHQYLITLPDTLLMCAAIIPWINKTTIDNFNISFKQFILRVWADIKSCYFRSIYWLNFFWGARKVNSSSDPTEFGRTWRTLNAWWPAPRRFLTKLRWPRQPPLDPNTRRTKRQIIINDLFEVKGHRV